MVTVLSAFALVLVLQAEGTKPAQQQERNRMILALEEAIKGKEEMPAEQVFKNIQTLKGMPAGRLLRVMEMAFVPALGVNCSHCHVPREWESDDNPQKQVARKMWTMQRDLTQQLRTITGKDDATVNCTTCHRGDTKPALTLPGMLRRSGN
jgi:hypothetical protein